MIGDWIKITDALPEDKQNCLVYWYRPGWEVCTFQARFYRDLITWYPHSEVNGPGFVSLDYSEIHPLYEGKISHWQPLPPPPTE